MRDRRDTDAVRISQTFRRGRRARGGWRVAMALVVTLVLSGVAGVAGPIQANDTPPFPRDLSAAAAARPLAGEVSRRAMLVAERSPARAGVRQEAVTDARIALQHALAPLDRLTPPEVPFPDLRGTLVPPVRDAEISGRFGHRRRPESHTTTRHHGTSWRVPAGAPVSAVAHGVVMATEFMPGLGGVVVVDHGGGYHTVYAQLLEIDVERGELVGPGHALGRGGNMSTFGEREVYFEVRFEGVAEDPLRWLWPAATPEPRGES